MRVAASLTLPIVITNNCELLRDCLQSIRDTVRQTSHEVIVVDNASDDASADIVEREFPECRLIRLSRREGYGASHNHAVAVAAGKYVLTLNEEWRCCPAPSTQWWRRPKRYPKSSCSVAGSCESMVLVDAHRTA
jgi:hypothetical protein